MMTNHSSHGRPEEDRIVTIAPAAPGWVACFTDLDSPGAEGELPVAVWALMEDNEGHTWVAGIEVSGEGALGRPADETSNFSQYRYRSASSS